MVVTDLSQSTDIEVVGTDRLYGILAEMKRQDDRVLTPEIISAVAERTGVDRVVVGSFMKSGEAIRINVRLQDAKTGRVESSERVEGANTSALFSMVDDLSRRIRAKFAGLRAQARLLTGPGADADESGLDRGLNDVTTSSIEAYRLYAEGVNLHERFREKEAAELFEKAAAVDPAFALAYAKLAVVHSNMGRIDLREKYSSMALKLSDRLPPRERFYIEGFHNAGRPETGGRAIDAYTKCINVDPGHQGCRHNLGLIYQNLERFPEAAEQYQHLARRGGTFAITYQNLSMVTLFMGDAERAVELSGAYVKRHPESSAAHSSHGSFLLGVNRPEEAIRSFAQAALLDTANPFPVLGRAVAETLRDNWDGVTDAGVELSKSSDQTWRWFGANVNYFGSLYRGRGADAVMWAERAATAYTVPSQRTATGYINATYVLLAMSRTDAAVKSAAQAWSHARGRVNEPNALVAQAVALSAAGRQADAAAAIATAASLANPLAEVLDGRTLNMGRGLAALYRGEAGAAIKPLEDAAAALPPRNGNTLAPSQHSLIWSALGQAYYDAGRPAEALPWFERLTAAVTERVGYPIGYVRSFYYLGRIYEQQGNPAKAREAYRRFVGYWGEGDLDRERVAEARRKISS
jgi:tetratricopeptide (TPR) repeat protein